MPQGGPRPQMPGQMGGMASPPMQGGNRMPTPGPNMFNQQNNSNMPPTATSGSNEMLRKHLEHSGPPGAGPGGISQNKSPHLAQQLGSNNQGNTPNAPGNNASSLLLSTLAKPTTSDPSSDIINKVANMNATKVPNDNLHPILNKQQPNMPNIKQEGGGVIGGPMGIDTIKTEPGSDIKPEIKSEPMDQDSAPGASNSSNSGANGPHGDNNADIKPNIKPEIKTEKQEADVKPAVDRKPPVKVSFTPEELRAALEPPLMKMYNQEPEASPFRVPVDPVALNIPDYYDIIKTPMDMSEVRRKLENGEYKDPWEYIDDIWLMFENAWTYNRKTSRVYKYCSKVSTNLNHCLFRRYGINANFLPFLAC